ncbi:MAG: hypothetical protein LBQ44_07350 [Treponema sp.]|jgi:hypothetical protein|nr:hypothetical protein [Treponema sp.]
MHNATEVRNRWSEYSDRVIREKPLFIKKTREYLFLSSFEQLDIILEAYGFTAKQYTETDGSVTLSLNEIDLIENGDTETNARLAMGRAILDYAEEYFNEFRFWNAAPNRKKHLPYILKALIINDAKTLGDMLVCQVGNN